MAVRRTSKPTKSKKKRRPSSRPKSRPAARKGRGSAKGRGSPKKAARSASSKRGAAARRTDKGKDRKNREKDRERRKREQERERLSRERERAKVARERERERDQREKAKARERLEKDRERARREKERDRERVAKERERARLEKERERDQREKAKARERKKKEIEAQQLAKKKALEDQRQKAQAFRETERVRKKAEREAERKRLKAEREAARIREKAEREAERERLREEARRIKEEERARREAEREAYRKAKEAEQARIRAEREAARRALEGRIAKAAGRAAKAAGRAGGSTRVYSPASIPDQSRTRRGVDSPSGLDGNRFANLRVPDAPEGFERSAGPIPRTIPPPPPPPPPATVEERFRKINERLVTTEDTFRNDYQESFLMSWIYHDSALEGVVYTYDELKTAINPSITVVPDSSLQSVCDEIRRHRAAIDLVRDLADKKRAPVTVDTAKRIYLTLHPDEGDLKTVKYRKDIPQHRLYFHEYAAPDKIAYKVRQVFDWLNGPEPKKIKSPIRIAARVHYDLLRVFPFPQDSGKVARLVMNLLLLRSDYPPAIIHSTERQRYYESLRGSLPTLVSMVTESIQNALQSIEKLLDERDSRMRAFVS